MIRNNAEWKASLRELALLPSPPIVHKGGAWRLSERKQTWKISARRIFDAHLDRFAKLAIEVLRERDPRFELRPEERYAASLYGKTPRFSRALRNGIAETLALLGSNPAQLSSCSPGKAEGTAARVVSTVLAGDWMQWASIDDDLPLLAEAAPRQFVEAVQTAIEAVPCPFVEAFAQEGEGILSQSLVSGLLWGLETLAWDDEWLVKVVILLGELASKDPGGTWANRPYQSLVDILLPWHPQTCAPAQTRLAAVRILVREQPAVGWKLLLAMLPGAVQATSGTRKPAFRETIPADWSDGVSQRAFHAESSSYAELAVDVAIKEPSKLVLLIDDLSRLSGPAFNRVLEHLGSQPILGMSEADRRPLWDALVGLARKHRRVAGAHWALTADEIAHVEQVAGQMAPTAPEQVYLPLFVSDDFELYDDLKDTKELMRDLKKRREKAVREVLAKGGLSAVTAFAVQAEAPEKVGDALGCVAPDAIDPLLLPEHLSEQDKPLRAFVRGYVWGRHWTRQFRWVNALDANHWTDEQKSTFLSWLPPGPEVWRRAERWLGDKVGAFWKEATVSFWDPPTVVLEGAQHLLQYGRPREALFCLARLLHQKGTFPPELAVQALESVTAEDLARRERHDIAEVVKWLQEQPGVEEKVLLRIEWRLLPILDHENWPGPKTLERVLATVPEFYCEILRTAFRSEREETSDVEPDETVRAQAENAYRLLNLWKAVPGRASDGSLDGNAFATWLSSMRALASESGHLGMALHQAGAVLVYAPPDPDGLWIHHAAAEALDAKDADDMRSGFTIKRFNIRGARVVAREDDRSIAAHERRQADAVEQAGYHRLAGAIRDAATIHERHADLMDAHYPTASSH